MIMDLRHKPYRRVDRKALADIAEFCKLNFNISIFKKSFIKDVVVLDYYSHEKSVDELHTLDVLYNSLLDDELYLIYSNVSDKPRICCKAVELWEFTSDGKNPNIWLYHPKIGMITWNCRTGCALIRPASTDNFNWDA